MRRLRWCLILLWPLLTGVDACPHGQLSGKYDFVTSEIIQDPCNLVLDAGNLASGTLVINGDVVRMDDFQFQGHPIALIGQYLSQAEAFSMDGSAANFTATASGQQCLVQLANVHVDATTVDAGDFGGTMRISYDTPYQTFCTCQAWLTFDAGAQ